MIEKIPPTVQNLNVAEMVMLDKINELVDAVNALGGESVDKSK